MYNTLVTVLQYSSTINRAAGLSHQRVGETALLNVLAVVPECQKFCRGIHMVLWHVVRQRNPGFVLFRFCSASLRLFLYTLILPTVSLLVRVLLLCCCTMLRVFACAAVASYGFL